MSEFPKRKVPLNDKQLDLPGFGPLKENELSLEPMIFESDEKIDPNDWRSDYKDVKIEFKGGQWFIDDEKTPVSFQEMKKVLKSTNKGLAFALRDKKFYRIYKQLEEQEKQK